MNKEYKESETESKGIFCPVCERKAANIQNMIYISDFGRCLACVEKERGEGF
ncbi:MAG: hypothetical protein FWB90_04430 [Fibromonadales bacterium]|nr:hypothetical protein [Fibromonadales bacterium]